MWFNDFRIIPEASYRSNLWSPNCNYDDDSGDIIVELPGVARGDVKVDIKNRVLTVEAKRNIGRGEQKWKRQWLIDQSANTEAISARLNSGILRISVPVSEQTQYREIEIQ